MTGRLSTASGAPCALLLASLALTGCVDTQKALDDFTDRVVDANNTTIDAPPIDELPDVDGEFLLGLSPSFAPAAIVRFIVDTQITENEDGTGVLELSLQPITVDEGTPVGPPLIANGIEEGSDAGAVPIVVAATGLFQAAIGGEVDGDANPASGSDLVFTATMFGQLRTDDLWCGDVDGQVTQPAMLSINGSTFASIRIEPGTVGNDNLPEVQITCPGGQTGDAGVDGGAIDAGVGDAAPADAAVDAPL